MKKHIRFALFSIGSIYLFCLFMLIARLIYSNELPNYSFLDWLNVQFVLVQFALWLPLVCGIVSFAAFLYCFLKQKDKEQMTCQK